MTGARAARSAALVALLALALAAGCASGGSGAVGTTVARQRTGPIPQEVGDERTVLAAGDVGSCEGAGDEQTAAVLDRLPGTVLLLGDTVYDEASREQYERCYEPSWGRHRERTRPVAGNHDYEVKGARGYYDYFGPLAGERGRGWYSFDLAGWHLIGLNSNCGAVGGCGPGSEQERWLRDDLAANPTRCTLAYWHHPRFSSGSKHGSSRAVDGLWDALVDGGADVVLSAHEHSYERFAPLDGDGRVDPAGGVRQFVVGTGGRSHYSFGSPVTGSEARRHGTFGVLRLTLGAEGYDWRFETVDGSPGDEGAGRCH